MSPRQPLAHLLVTKRMHRLHSYPCHSKMLAKNAPALASFYTPIFDLGRSSVAMHLRQLKLRLSAGSAGKGSIADDVPEGLSGKQEAQRRLPQRNTRIIRAPYRSVSYFSTVFLECRQYVC